MTILRSALERLDEAASALARVAEEARELINRLVGEVRDDLTGVDEEILNRVDGGLDDTADSLKEVVAHFEEAVSAAVDQAQSRIAARLGDGDGSGAGGSGRGGTGQVSPPDEPTRGGSADSSDQGEEWEALVEESHRHELGQGKTVERLLPDSGRFYGCPTGSKLEVAVDDAGDKASVVVTGGNDGLFVVSRGSGEVLGAAWCGSTGEKGGLEHKLSAELWRGRQEPSAAAKTFKQRAHEFLQQAWEWVCEQGLTVGLPLLVTLSLGTLPAVGVGAVAGLAAGAVTRWTRASGSRTAEVAVDLNGLADGSAELTLAWLDIDTPSLENLVAAVEDTARGMGLNRTETSLVKKRLNEHWVPSLGRRRRRRLRPLRRLGPQVSLGRRRSRFVACRPQWRPRRQQRCVSVSRGYPTRRSSGRGIYIVPIGEDIERCDEPDRWCRGRLTFAPASDRVTRRDDGDMSLVTTTVTP